MPKRRTLPLVLATVLGCILASIARPALAGDVDRLIIFGDSLSDTGNVDDLTSGLLPGSDYFDGRFSNGPLWIEELATALELAVPLCSRCGGLNYAYGGATSATGNSSLIIPNVGRQVDMFLDDTTGPTTGDLFVIFAGANDFFDGQTNPQIVVDNISARVATLAAAGATEFLIPNLPPLGQTPRFVGTPDEAIMDQLIDDFNAALGPALDAQATSLEITIRRYDVGALFQQVLAAPQDFGLDVVDVAAYDAETGVTVPNPEVYLFWDEIHPTTVGHTELGHRVAAIYTCPADINQSGVVDFADVLLVLTAWGTGGATADIDSDGMVQFSDLLIVLSAWGPCS